jgi:hypothetical protein
MAITTSALSYKDIMNVKTRLDTSKILPPYSQRDLDDAKMQELLKLYQTTWQSLPKEIWDIPEQYNCIPSQPEKEPTMKPLFQFTTVRPNAEVIWSTLFNHHITATAGHTVDELRFYMFVVLQLREDFKSAKELCNNYESRAHELKIAMVDLLNLDTEQSTKHLRVPPADLPLWVDLDHMLYIPYYMLKQLGLVRIDLWRRLFDRETVTEMESDHLVTDLLPISESITAYKLWYYGNDIIAEKYSDIFEVDNTCIHLTIYSKVELITVLNEYVLEQITDSDSHIYDYSYKISIPQFTLGVSDASQ